MEYYSAIKKNAFESVLMRWMKLEPVVFPGGSDGKASACNEGEPGLIPGLGRSPEEGNVCPLQYSCLENSTDSKEPVKLQSIGSQRVGRD